MRPVLFLGASVSQLDAIREARDRGFKVVAVDADPDADRLRGRRRGGCNRFQRRGQVSRDCTPAQRLGDRCDLDRSGSSGRRSSGRGARPPRHRSRDSAIDDRTRGRCALGSPSTGCQQPPFAIIDRDDDPAEALAAVGSPAVLKPVDSGGQRGIFMIDDLRELQERLPEALSFSRSEQAIRRNVRRRERAQRNRDHQRG